MPAAIHAAILEGGMAETVIGCPLLRIFQRLVGFVDFLEPVLAGVIAGIAVRMELHGKLAESTFQLFLVSAFLDAQRLVEISFHVVLLMTKLPTAPASKSFSVRSVGFRFSKSNARMP